MELRQLRAFVAVAAEGHFGRAAARLNLTQPGLTLRIQALEKEIGAHLLERNAREVHLTAAGTALLPYAKSLIRIEDRALRELKDQAEGIAGRLRIGYLSSGAVAFPGRVVAEFRRPYPTVQVDTSSDYSGVNAERLREGMLDVAFLHPGFVGFRGAATDGIALRLLSRDNIVLALNPNHELAKLERVPVKALRRKPLVIFVSSPYKAFIVELERFLAAQLGEEPNIVGHEPPDLALQEVIRSTSLITFANGARAASIPVPGIAYRRLSPEPLIDFGVAYFQDDESPSLANFLRLVDELAPDQPSELPNDCVLLAAQDHLPDADYATAARR